MEGRAGGGVGREGGERGGGGGVGVFEGERGGVGDLFVGRERGDEEGLDWKFLVRARILFQRKRGGGGTYALAESRRCC